MPEFFSQQFSVSNILGVVMWAFILSLATRWWLWLKGTTLVGRKRELLFWVLVPFGFVVAMLALSFVTASRSPSAPELRGTFDQIVFTPVTGANEVGILIMFSVKNLGTPSVVDNYKLTVAPPGKEASNTTLVFLPKVLVVTPAAGVSPSAFPIPYVCGKDALYRKTIEQPLANGGMSRGYLWYQLNGYTAENFINPVGTQFQMTFTDVMGRVYAADFVWPAVTINGGYAPGTNIPKPVAPGASPETACD